MKYYEYKILTIDNSIDFNSKLDLIKEYKKQIAQLRS